MVVKACFQINTETIGLDLSQLLFSNRDGLLVVDDFLSEAEVGSKQSWIFWGNEWKHLLIVMCYVGGWNPQGNRWDSGCNGPGQGPRHILHHWPSTGSILSSLVKASQKKNLSFRYYPYWEAPPPKLILTLFQKWKKSPKLCVGHGRGKRCFFLGVLPLARDLTASNHHHLCPFSIIITVNITKTIIIVTNIIFRPQTYISLNLETRYATSSRRTPLMRFLFNINDGF